MNQIDIKYHVISIVAVFLSLGVGIFVGSNTNVFNVDSMMKKQDAIIRRLEGTHKELQMQIEIERARQKEGQDYIAQLEQKSIPLLMEGRLRGLSVGLVEIGDFEENTGKSAAVVDVLNRADCVMAFKLRMTPESLRRMVEGANAGGYAGLAAEMLLGASHTAVLTPGLQEEGTLLAGNFQKPVQGVVFVLGANVNTEEASKSLLPLENAIAAREGAVVNVSFGETKEYLDLFSETKLPLLHNIETVSSQAELINRLGSRI